MTVAAATPGSLRWYTAALGVVAFGILGFTAADLAGRFLLFIATSLGNSWLRDPAGGAALLSGLATLTGFAFATLVIGVRLLRLDAADLRLSRAGPRLAGLGLGFASGALAVGLALLLGVGVAGARWTGDQGSFGTYLSRILLLLVVLAPAAAAEEVIFRGVPLVVLTRMWGPRVATVLLAILFGLSHYRNPSVTHLGLVNIAVAGLALGAAFFAPGGLWTAFGLHLGWNWTITALDAPVSGFDFRVPFINYLPGRPDWLTGGAFGPEGGVLATVVLAVLTVGVAQWALVGTRQAADG